MKTVFFGSPAAALPALEALLAAGHTVELVVTQPDKPAGRGRRLPSAVKTFAAERRIPVVTPAKIRTDEDARERIVAAGPDINVVVAYGQIIPHAVHFFPPHHSMNVHFSLLPKYRGAAPVQWTVLNGDAESGVTIIELSDRMDEGDILARERVFLAPRASAPAFSSRPSPASTASPASSKTTAWPPSLRRSARRMGASSGSKRPPPSIGGSSPWPTVRASSPYSGEKGSTSSAGTL